MHLKNKISGLVLVFLSLVMFGCKPDEPEYFEDLAFDLAGETSKTWVMNAMPTGPCAPHLLLPLNALTNLTLYREDQLALYDDFNCITRASWSIDGNQPGRTGRKAYLTLIIFDPLQQINSPYQQRFLVTVNGGAISLTDQSTGARYTGIASETPYDVNAICNNGIYDPGFENGKDCGGFCPIDCGTNPDNPIALIGNPDGMAILGGGQNIAFIEGNQVKIISGPDGDPIIFRKFTLSGVFDINRSSNGGFIIASDPGNFQLRNFQSDGAELSPITLLNNGALTAQETHIRVSNQSTVGLATYSNTNFLSGYNNANQITATGNTFGVFDITLIDNIAPAKIFALVGAQYELYSILDVVNFEYSLSIGGLIDADFGTEVSSGQDFIYAINNATNQLVVIDELDGSVVQPFDLSSYGNNPGFISVSDDLIAVYFTNENRVVFFDHDRSALPNMLTPRKTWNLNL